MSKRPKGRTPTSERCRSSRVAEITDPLLTESDAAQASRRQPCMLRVEALTMFVNKLTMFVNKLTMFVNQKVIATDEDHG